MDQKQKNSANKGKSHKYEIIMPAKQFFLLLLLLLFYYYFTFVFSICCCSCSFSILFVIISIYYFYYLYHTHYLSIHLLVVYSLSIQYIINIYNLKFIEVYFYNNYNIYFMLFLPFTRDESIFSLVSLFYSVCIPLFICECVLIFIIFIINH